MNWRHKSHQNNVYHSPIHRLIPEASPLFQTEQDSSNWSGESSTDTYDSVYLVGKYSPSYQQRTQHWQSPFFPCRFETAHRILVSCCQSFLGRSKQPLQLRNEPLDPLSQPIMEVLIKTRKNKTNSKSWNIGYWKFEWIWNKPPATEHATPSDLAMRVLKVTTPGIWTPFKNDLIKGIPDPAELDET